MQQNFFWAYMSVHTLVLVGGGENVDMVVGTLVWIYCMYIATKLTSSTLIICREEVFVEIYIAVCLLVEVKTETTP